MQHVDSLLCDAMQSVVLPWQVVCQYLFVHP